MTNQKVRSARGTRGFLLRSLDGAYFFRIYEQDGSFRDYKLSHSDLEIEIVDDEATFYEDDEQPRLDHSPRTLGIE